MPEFYIVPPRLIVGSFDRANVVTSINNLRGDLTFTGDLNNGITVKISGNNIQYSTIPGFFVKRAGDTFLGNLDFTPSGSNYGLALAQLPSDPGTGRTGGLYFNTTDAEIKYYYGSVGWTSISFQSGISVGYADANYLRLDASNDPMQGDLSMNTYFFQVGNKATQLSAGQAGQIYWNTDSYRLEVYNNDTLAWEAIRGIQSLNGLTEFTQTFSTGVSGNSFNIVSSSGNHTFNIPIAGTGATGLVSTLSQSFAGSKTFTNDTIISSTTQSTTNGSGALSVYGGLAVSSNVSIGQTLLFFNSNNSNYIGIRANTATASTTYILPSTTPASGSSFLSSTIDGTLSWNAILSVPLSSIATTAQNINLVSATANTTFYLTFSNSSSGSGVALSAGTALTYNASTKALSSDLFLGNLVGSAVTATNFYGTLNGTATTSTNVHVTSTGNTSSNHFLLLSRFETGTGLAVSSATGLSYNPSTGVLIGTTFQGNVQGNVFGSLTGFATTATNINVVSSGSNSTNHFLLFTRFETGTGLAVSSASGLSYNPSTGVLIGTTFQGDLSGIADTALYSHIAGYAITSGFAVSSGLATSSIYSDKVAIVETDADFAHPLVFSLNTTTSSTGTALSIDDTATYNPSSNILNLSSGSLAANGVTIGSAQRTISTNTGNLILDSVGGTVQVNDNLTVSGNLTVQGTTTTIDSTVTSFKDPVIVLGAGDGNTHSLVDDNKDRGVEFRYAESGTAITGFFGYKDDKKFYYIPNASVNDNVYTGTAGTIVANLEGIASTSNYSTLAATATSSANVFITTGNSNSNHPIVFTPNSSSSGSALSTNTVLSYNPSTDTLNTSKLIAISNQSARFYNTTDLSSGYDAALYVEGGLAVSNNIAVRKNVLIGSTYPSNINSTQGAVGATFIRIVSPDFGYNGMGVQFWDGQTTAVSQPTFALVTNAGGSRSPGLRWSGSGSSTDMAIFRDSTNSLNIAMLDDTRGNLYDRLVIGDNNGSGTQFTFGFASAGNSRNIRFATVSPVSGTDLNGGEWRFIGLQGRGNGTPGTFLFSTGDRDAGNPTTAHSTTTALTIDEFGVIVGFAKGTNSTSTLTGTARINGGLGVTGNAFIGGTVTITNTTTSTLTTNGALVVSGGVGIAGSVFVGGELNVRSGRELRIFNTNNTRYNAFKTEANGVDITYTLPTALPATGTGNSVLVSNDSGTLSWTVMTATGPGGGGAGTVDQGLQNQIPYYPSAGTLVTGSSNFTNIPGSGVSIINPASNSSSTTTGALVVRGGVGITGNLYVGGSIVGNLTGTATTAQSVNIVSTSQSGSHYLLFTPQSGTVSGGGVSSKSTVTLDPSTNNIALSTGNLTANGVVVGSAPNTISTSSGDLKLNSTGGTVIVQGNLNVQGTTTTIDSTITTFKDPVIVLGAGDGNTHSLVDDGKDRGLEFRYAESGTAITGFFGYKDDKKFYYIPNASVNDNVYTGTAGTIVANLEGTATTSNYSSQSGFATTASNVNLFTSTEDSNFFITFSKNRFGSGIALSSGIGLSFNPNSNTLTADKVISTQLTGTLQTGSQTNITQIGTITTGVWNASAIATTYGGTGLTTYNQGDLLVGTGASILGKLPVGSVNNYVLTVDSAQPLGVKWASIPATPASSVSVNPTDDAGTRYITFVDSSSSASIALSTDTSLTYDAANNLLNVGILSGSAVSFVNGANYSAFKYSGSAKTTYTLPDNTPQGTGTSVLASDQGGIMYWTPMSATSPGSATTAKNIETTLTDANSSHYLIFSNNSGTSGVALSSTSGLQINPSSDAFISGSWQASAIATTYGGTGLTTYNQGDILVGTGASILTVLPKGPNRYVLSSNTYYSNGIGWTQVAGVSITNLAPSTVTALNTDLWWNNEDGSFNIYYDDGNTSQWVEISNAFINPDTVQITSTDSAGTKYLTFSETSSGSGLSLFSDTNLTYDSSSNQLFVGSLSGSGISILNGSNYSAFVYAGSAKTTYTLPANTPQSSAGTSVLSSTIDGIMSWVPMTATGPGGSGTVDDGNIYEVPYYYSGTAITGSSGLINLAGSGITITYIADSISKTTGALVVSGGLGIAGNAFIGGTINVSQPITISNGGTNTSSFGQSEGVITFDGANNRLTTSTGFTFSSGNLYVTNLRAATAIFANNQQMPNGTAGGAGNISKLTMWSGNNTITSATGMTIVDSNRSILRFITPVNSTSTSTGNVVIDGGIGVSGNAFIGGTVVITNTTNSTSITSGALEVDGGVAIGQSVSVGGRIQLFNSSLYTAFVSAQSGISTVYTLPATTPQSSAGTSVLSSTIDGVMSWVPMTATGGANIGYTVFNGNNFELAYYFQNGTGVTGAQYIHNVGTGMSLLYGTNSSSTSTGALVIRGGLGITGNAFIGGTITASTFTGNVTGDVTGNLTGTATTATNINSVAGAADTAHYLLFSLRTNGTGIAVSSGTGLSFNPNTSLLGVQKLSVFDTTDSTSSSTGALLVTSGVGIGQSLSIGGRLQIFNGTNSGFAAFRYTGSGNTVYTLPDNAPISIGASFLTSDLTGNLAWIAAPSGGTGNPGGSDTQIQFNDGGAFGGTSLFTYVKSTNVVSVASTSGQENFYATGLRLINDRDVALSAVQVRNSPGLELVGVGQTGTIPSGGRYNRFAFDVIGEANSFEANLRLRYSWDARVGGSFDFKNLIQFNSIKGLGIGASDDANFNYFVTSNLQSNDISYKLPHLTPTVGQVLSVATVSGTAVSLGWSSSTGSGTITQINAGIGLTTNPNGPITTSGTIIARRIHRIQFASSFNPTLGADSAVFTVPFDPNDGTSSMTMRMKRVECRVETTSALGSSFSIQKYAYRGGLGVTQFNTDSSVFIGSTTNIMPGFLEIKGVDTYEVNQTTFAGSHITAVSGDKMRLFFNDVSALHQNFSISLLMEQEI